MKTVKRRISWPIHTACFLTLVGSADDFELLRFMLPGLPYSTRAVIDDKNGDFLEPDSNEASLKSQICMQGPISGLGSEPVVACFQWDTCPGQIAGYFREAFGRHVPEFIPLRC